MSPKYSTKTSLNCGRKSGYGWLPGFLTVTVLGVDKTHQTGIIVLDMYATSHVGTLKSALCQLW